MKAKLKSIDMATFFQSYGLEGLLNPDYPYVGKEKIFKKLKNLIIKVDEYGSYRFMLLNDNKDVIGCLQVVHNKAKTIASNIFVHENFRRKGLSGVLIEHAYKLFPNMVFSENTNYMSEGMIKKYKKIN